MSRSRYLCLIFALASFAASCTDAEPDGYATADRILTAASRADRPEGTGTARPPEVLAAAQSPDCELETRQDEYGMEFEICVGPETSGPIGDSLEDADGPGTAQALEIPAGLPATEVVPTARFEVLVRGVPEGSGAAALAKVEQQLVEADDACGRSMEEWGAQLEQLTPLLLEAGTALAADEALADYRGEPDARELARAVVERVVIPSGCLVPAPLSTPLDEAELVALTDTTAGAAAAVEPVYQALWGQDKSPFFYHPDELAHRQWMRADGSVQMVVAGTSQALLGIEPDLLAEELAVSVGSVALPGAVAEVQQHWLPEVTALVEPSVVLWGIGPLDLVSVCTPDGRAEEFARLSVLHGDMFAPARGPHGDASSEVSGADWFDFLTGLPESTAYSQSPTSLALDRRFPGERGDAFEFAQPDRAELAASLEQFRAPFERGDYCAERLVVMRAVIADLVADGRQVVVFGLPVAPSLAATFDGGAAALVELMNAAGANVLEPAGAQYVGMLRSADDDGLWFDVVHPTRAGGEALSAELGAALAELGL